MEEERRDGGPLPGAERREGTVGGGSRSAWVRPNSCLRGGGGMLALRGQGCLPRAVSQRGFFGSQRARRGRLRGGRRAGCSLARAGACTCVCTVGRCRACARHGRDARPGRLRVPPHRRPAPPGENTAQNPGSGAAGGRLGEPSGRKEPSPRPAVERANADSQQPKTRNDATRVSTHPKAEREPSGLARTRWHPGALPARSGERHCWRVLRGEGGVA